MTDLLSDLETPSDAELISRVRGGDVAAYGELFSRHREAAHRLARQLVRGPDSDDLVSEAFAKVLSVLQGGGGPDVAFRAYLLTSVRRLHVDRMRTVQRLQTTDDMTPFDPGVPFLDTAVAGFESGAAAKAFASLPERWQLVLWHLEVEGQKPADIAPLLGMSANSVSALAYRAREGLRQAFLTMHISDLTETDCRWVNEHLGAFIRKGLSKRDTGKVQSHLDECRRCTAMYLELTEVNSNLAAIIGPLLLGAAASGYLASGGAGAAGVLGLLGKVKELVVANSGAATAAGVAAGVAAVATVAAVTFGGSSANTRDPVLADPPAAVSTPASAAPTLPTFPAAPSTGVSASASPAAAVATPTPTASPVAALAAGATPTPTDAPVGAPTDTPTPDNGPTTDPATPSSTIDLSGTTIDDGGVHLRATGSPGLPPTLTVRLSSDPVGVTFASSPDCTVAADGASAACTTVTGGSGARAPGAAKMVASTSYNAELPFSIPGDQRDTDISISVDVPDGYEVSGGNASVKPWRSRTADVSLLLPGEISAGTDGTHLVLGQVTGLPADYAGAVTFRVVSGTVVLQGSTTPGCHMVNETVVCDHPANGVVEFTIAALDTSHANGLTMKVDTLTGYRDWNLADNQSSATLRPVPSTTGPDADLTLTDVPATVDAEVDGTYRFNGVLGGVPESYGDKVRFTIASGAASFIADQGCTLDGASLVCSGTNGLMPFHLRATNQADNIPLTIKVEPLTGYSDDRRDNNEASTALQAVAPPAYDVRLTSLKPKTETADTSGAQQFTASFDRGGYLGDITFELVNGPSHATLSAPNDPHDGTVTFTVTSNDSAAQGIAVRANRSDGAPDAYPSDNTATSTWYPRRYDVQLSDLTRVTDTATREGAQQFTATLNRDEFPGEVSFELIDGPTGARLSAPSNPGSGSVTFTVTSESTVAHQVIIQANLPDGIRDSAPGNNSTFSAWSPNRTSYDLVLSAGFTTYDRNAKHGVIDLTVQNAPAGRLHITVAANESVTLIGSTSCMPDGSGAGVFCDVPSNGTFATSLDIDLPPGQQDKVRISVTAEGFTDPDGSNNTDIPVTRPTN